MTADEEITEIKLETFHGVKDSRRVWIIEERGADFVVHTWYGTGWVNGAGVGPQSSYPTLRKAAARLLQMLAVGVIAPQTWPEKVCIGSVNMDAAEPQ